jgi:hypothetical protein
MRSSESLNLISLSSHRVRIWYPKGVYKCGKFTELSTMCYFLVPFTVFSLACDSSIWALWHEATIIPKRNHNSRTKRTEKPNFKAFQDHFIINSFDRASTGSGDPPSTLSDTQKGHREQERKATLTWGSEDDFGPQEGLEMKVTEHPNRAADPVLRAQGDSNSPQHWGAEQKWLPEWLGRPWRMEAPESGGECCYFPMSRRMKLAEVQPGALKRPWKVTATDAGLD